MYPHERSLVETYKDRPFAILGVNSDADLAELAKVLEKERITWRSFTNGPEGTSGPISTKWNVRGWPTLYLIDAEGIIRHSWLGGPPAAVLDAEIEKLVQAAEAKSAK